MEEQGEAGIEGDELWARKLPDIGFFAVLRDCPRPYKRLRLSSMSLPKSLAWTSLLPSHLTHLSLTNLHLTDSSPVLSALSQFPFLSLLNLSGNFIQLSTGDWLCALVALSDLNLSENWLGSKGLKVLSDALLKISGGLKMLRLSKVCAEGEGLISLLATLPQTKISNLDLSYNALHTFGYEALLAVLPVVRCLESLNLEGNCLSDAQVLGLLQLCAFLQTPSTLLLGENFTSAEVDQQIKSFHKRNLTIQTMANIMISGKI